MPGREGVARVAVLGASGGVGRRIVEGALERGYAVACQTRASGKLSALAGRAEIHAFEPRDPAGLRAFVRGADIAVFALGTDRMGPTRLFSETTAALIAAMTAEGTRRLIAITGVGAGETRGHGGLLYDRIVFPLFVRHRYADKNRQEALIAASDLDWIIVRPAPFSERRAPGELEVHIEVSKDTVLRRVTRDEVADFVVEQFDSDRYLRQRPFIGHP